MSSTKVGGGDGRILCGRLSHSPTQGAARDHFVKVKVREWDNNHQLIQRMRSDNATNIHDVSLGLCWLFLHSDEQHVIESVRYRI